MRSDPWHYGTWEGARDATREDNLRLSFAETISLLENMEQVAVTFGRQRLREGLPLEPKIASLVAAAVAEEPAPYLPANPPFPPTP